MPDEQEARKERYDAACRKVLLQKDILAQLLKDCTEDIASKYIQSIPEVG